MSNDILAMAAAGPRQPLRRYGYDPGAMGPEQVEIAVEYCGICHSDLSMLRNDFGLSAYPLVPGHEAVGVIVALGNHTKGLKLGQRVGLGWYSGSCLHCHQCLAGDHNLCPTAEQTIVGRHGAFATRVRTHWAWAIPLPEALDPAKAGPLFCGGITVFNPIVQFGVRPTDRVGVIGVGGLGHLAVQFLNQWGCHVTAFTSTEAKQAELQALGAHQVVSSRDPKQLAAIAGSLNFILSTVNVALDWPGYVNTLAPKGRLHFVGVVTEPISLPLFPLLVGQKSISASPLGSPATTATMLDFAARRHVAPVVEEFPMSEANAALARLESGQARYRIVLKNDLT